MPSTKLPYIQLYTGDILKDPGVRSVSLAARGLWFDILCIMHEAPRRGYLQLNGTPLSPEQLARIVGATAEEVSRLLEELEHAGVFSRTTAGTIYNRRMVRDDKERIRHAQRQQDYRSRKGRADEIK